jgi:hypothetical protein
LPGAKLASRTGLTNSSPPQAASQQGGSKLPHFYEKAVPVKPAASENLNEPLIRQTNGDLRILPYPNFQFPISSFHLSCVAFICGFKFCEFRVSWGSHSGGCHAQVCD